MKKNFTAILILLVLLACALWLQNKNIEPEPLIDEVFAVTPISHATSVINFDGNIIYVDPVGGSSAFDNQSKPDLILITDIHGDHLSIETLEALNLSTAQIIAPQAVFENLSDALKQQTLVLNNNEITNFKNIIIETVPMYNLPQSDDTFHTKGRGNGYVLNGSNKRIYIAGDTADIPEMRALKNIDIAFVPMNLPYTMTVEDAADAVLDFAPKRVYPYHYRGKDGFADVEKFKEMVEGQNSNIEVVLLEWYVQ